MSRAFAWLRRWGISFASLLSGLATLFVFRRGLPHVRWIIGYLLLLWLLFAVLTQLRQSLETRGHRFVVTAADYTIQTLYHGLLLFVLPAYWASTTLASANVFFFLLLVALALLATFDPWYQVVVQPRPWLGYVFFLCSIFAALNVALPLVGIPPHLALVLSAWVALLAITPAVRRVRDWPWSRAFQATAIGAVGAGLLAHAGRELIPPAPLSLARAVIARSMDGWDPGDPISRGIPASELGNGLYAYTAVYAPAGLTQPIVHVWSHNGLPVTTVRLSPVHGGRREGFRTYSHKTSFPADPIGRWSVDVRTSSGQLIGRLRFRVTS